MARKSLALIAVGLFLATCFAGVADAQVYKDPNASVEDRVNDLLSQMTFFEKAMQLAGGDFISGMMALDPEAVANEATFNTFENYRLGIPAMKFTDGPRGPRWGNCTTFPVGISRGASWNPDVELMVGGVMGFETKYKGRNCLLMPCINVIRDPRFGRSQETYGEDPYLLGEMGVAAIKGVQSQGVMAEVKHYAVNNHENTRQTCNEIIDERTLREIYLPHFEKCVKEGDVATIMGAYNLVNGYYCCGNYHLLRDILKGEWAFDGIVVSDWGATNIGPVQRLQYNPEEIDQRIPTKDAAEFLAAGLDIEMPFGVYLGLVVGAEAGAQAIPEQLLDDAVKRVLRKKFEFGLFDNAIAADESMIQLPQNVEIAREAERQGIVLLKNEAGTLPFDVSEIKTLAVIGPSADDKDLLGDHGSSNAQPGDDNIVTTLAGIKNYVGSEVQVSYLDGSDVNAAAELARNSDAVILVVGRNYNEEGEGFDLESLSLPRNQPKLIDAVVAANGNCAVVIIAGNAIAMDDWIANSPAILMAWYPGMEGGNAIADVVFGDYNPGGKLPMTFPMSEDQLLPFNNDETEMEIPYYHGYRLFDKMGMEPLFEFGYGLSYTTFEYSNLRISEEAILPDGVVFIKADVKNTGDAAGDEVAQLYIGYEGSAVDRPVKELKGFDRIRIEPGEKKTVTFELDADDLGYWNTQKGQFETESIKHIVYVGSSSRNLPLTGSFIIGEAQDISENYGTSTPGFEAFALIGVIVCVSAMLGKKKK